LLRSGKRVTYCLLDMPYGHDGFLVDTEQLSRVVRAFLPWICRPENGNGSGRPRPWLAATDNGHKLRSKEFEMVLDMVEPGSRVLDLGCGSGELLSLLADRRGCRGTGVDIDPEAVFEVIDRGHDIVQGDIDAGLSMIPDGSYDYAILSETLQVVRRPRLVLREMLRVAREGIVIFPNFGCWSRRLQLGLRGRMPAADAETARWFDSPGINPFTQKDFFDLCREDDIRIQDMVCLPSGMMSRALVRMRSCNLGADRTLVKITRANGVHVQKACRCGNCRPDGAGVVTTAE
jgi:methionine biosynthesis protein MetW